MIQVSTLAFVVLAIVAASAFTPAQQKFQQESLAHHNTLRKRHCAPALTIDPALNKVAQDYADHLASKNIFQHSNNGHGENLYMMGSSAAISAVSGTNPTQSWYDEIKDYKYSAPGFAAATGHFTQVVWKGTTKVGFGVGFTADRKRSFVVASYSPPGNYLNQFAQNVLPANC